MAMTAYNLVVAQPSPASARYELEYGRGKQGTKILMVEWEDGDDNSAWEVTWEGKGPFWGVREGIKGGFHRLTFLLPVKATLPAVVKLIHREGRVMYAASLPALLPAAWVLSAMNGHKRGVLHTIWARKRLSALHLEILNEMRINQEGIGLELALQEQRWIEDCFGVSFPQALPSRPKATGHRPDLSSANVLNVGTQKLSVGGEPLRSELPGGKALNE